MTEAGKKVTFLGLFKRSVVTQSLLSLMIVGTVCYMAVMGMEVTVQMAGMAMLILGFFFGSKVQNAINGK